MLYNVIGFGVMGRQIAALLSCLDYKINIYDRSLNESKKKLFFLNQKILSRKFNVTCDQQKISFTRNIKDIKQGLTIETIVENLETKRQIIKELDFEIGDGSLLTNSSSYTPSEIHSNAIGFHFFNPIHIVKIIEVTRFLPRNVQLCRLIDDLTLKLEYHIENVGENRGYIGNFILFNEIATALMLIDIYGYNLNQIERISSQIGKNYSVFEIIDLVGVDVTLTILLNLRRDNDSVYVSPSLYKAIESGIFGKKNKTSFKKYLNNYVQIK